MLQNYDFLLKDITSLLESARKVSARSVNAILTATYWEIGRQIVEFDQGGVDRAQYGEKLLKKLADDLRQKFGKGHSVDNLETMRLFYLAYSPKKISETLSRKSGESSAPLVKSETASRKFDLTQLVQYFSLSWSHYVNLVRRIKTESAREFYETEALRGGWSVRQLDRQISSQFYERTALSKNKAAMLEKGSKAKHEDEVTPEEEIKDPYVLEFLGLKDEYSESDLEEALICHLEKFLMELGGDFAFIGRQKRLRVGSEWYRVDLLFFHRKLRCLVVIDLKVGKFTHADAGQMHLYLNYAREHWMNKEENPPVGLILCAEKDAAVAKYALEGLPNKVLAREYKLVLPQEKKLIQELEATRRKFEAAQK
ncbi:MAG: DUF1016 domain-containing protein [Candidatus Omnitrophica bacterium]|nr:DUF1016 domain-containing protein [Candidatus Omnitrophota bacterium]